MLEKMIKFTSLRSLSSLSKAPIKLGNNDLRCYFINPLKLKYSEPLKFSSKAITYKSITWPSLLQLEKVTINNFIQKRCHSTHGNHVTLWKLERIVSAAFIPLLPLCLIYENAILDSVLAVFSVIHVHWGLEAIILDYARPIVVGPIVPKLCFISLYLVSAFTLGGLMVLIYNGPGISKVIKNGWTIGKEIKNK